MSVVALRFLQHTPCLSGVELPKMFASPHVDGFIIASSTDTHAPLLERCAAVYAIQRQERFLPP